MFLSYLTLFVALSLSIVAAWYSILGLTAIFAAAVIPIIIMGGILEVAKITVTVWLHEYWHRCRWLMKLYLVPAVGMLMLITSMGIFGFLSKAHMDQNMVSGDVQAQIAVYDEKIKTERENIDANRKILKQLDEAVDQVMARSQDEKGADKAVAIRKTQQKDRSRISQEIAESQKTIAALNQERAPIAAEVRKVEAEVGPIKYIAALIYGDDPDANVLERAVRWVIIILVVVFDPLAIMMVLASTESIKWERENRRRPEYEPDDGPLTEEQIDQIKETVEPVDDTNWMLRPDPSPPGWMYNTTTTYPSTEEEVEELAQASDHNKHAYLNQPFVHFENLKPMVYKPEPVLEQIDDHDDEPDVEDSVELKTASMLWKEQNPDKTLKGERAKLARGEIDQLPWMSLLANHQTNTGFGTEFPPIANKGDSFVRVDVFPNAVYKFNGNRWISVDKTLSDNYTYNIAYIDHLIDKVATGEYDIDLLTDSERDQVTTRLQQR